MSEIHVDASLAASGPFVALDGSGPRASVALVLRDASVKEINLDAKVLPSDGLILSIQRVLHDANLAVSQLKALAVGLGPGSYTGLRVALASAKGLALGGGVDVYGFSSLAMLALSASIEHQLGANQHVLAVRDALRGSVYAGLYKTTQFNRMDVVMPDALVELPKLAEHLGNFIPSSPALVTGDAAPMVAPVFGALLAPEHPRALCGLLMCQSDLTAKKSCNLAELTPNYLRPSLSTPVPKAKK